MALTNKQQAFIEFYLQCWNASEAARRAGYTGDANTVGPRLLANVGITEQISARLEELKASANEVLTRLTSHARGTMESFMVINDDGAGSLDLVKASEAKQLHLIKKLKTTRRYLKEGESEVTNEIELYDAQSALEKLGRAHALFKDRQEIGGIDGKAIQVQATDYRTAIAALAPRPVDDSNASSEG